MPVIRGRISVAARTAATVAGREPAERQDDRDEREARARRERAGGRGGGRSHATKETPCGLRSVQPAVGPGPRTDASDSNRCSILTSPQQPALDRSDAVAPTPYAELHCHTNFSFLDGASPADDLVERAVELGLTGLAVTDHPGLYGAVRFVGAAEAAGPPPGHRDRDRAARRGRRRPGSGRRRRARRRAGDGDRSTAGPRPRGTDAAAGRVPSRACRPGRGRERARLPGHREPVEGGPARRSASGQRGPHLVLLARDATGYRSLCRLDLAGEPRRHQGRAALHPGAARRAHRGARRAVGLPRRGDRAPAAGGRSRRGAGAWRSGTRGCSGAATAPASSGFFIELSHHLLPDDDWLVAGVGAPGRRARACRSSSPTTSTTPGPRTASCRTC